MRSCDKIKCWKALYLAAPFFFLICVTNIMKNQFNLSLFCHCFGSCNYCCCLLSKGSFFCWFFQKWTLFVFVLVQCFKCKSTDLTSYNWMSERKRKKKNFFYARICVNTKKIIETMLRYYAFSWLFPSPSSLIHAYRFFFIRIVIFRLYSLFH